MSSPASCKRSSLRGTKKFSGHLRYFKWILILKISSGNEFDSILVFAVCVPLQATRASYCAAAAGLQGS